MRFIFGECVGVSDMIRGLGIGICVLDMDMRIRYANSWYEQLFGDDTGRHYYEICGAKPTIHDEIVKSFEKDRSMGVVQTVRDRNGGTFDAMLSITPLLDSLGRRFAGIEIVHDVLMHANVRSRIETALSESSGSCESLESSDVPTALSGIFVIDEDGNITGIDQPGAETEGESNLPLGMGLIAPPSLLFGRSGERCTVDSGELSGLSKIADNLAQSNIELADSIRSRDEVLNTVAHELRNPITIIHAYSELLHEGRLGDISEKQKSALLKILKNSDRITNLITDMLDASKIRSGKIVLNLEEVSVNKMINEIVDNLRSLADEKKIKLKRDLQDLPAILIDRNLVGRAVINLLDNAIKFTLVGGDIVVTTVNKGDVVEIAVSDTGIGIPAGKQHAIFEEFEQAETNQGTGLGLAIARKIVEMHQGLLELNSVEGSGSTFTVILPVGGVIDNKNRNQGI